MNLAAKLYLKNNYSDDQFRKIMEQFLQQPLDYLYVLPGQIERVQNLLPGLTTKIGTVIDYPLNTGIVSKIIFEANDLLSQGAKVLLISLSWRRIMEDPNYWLDLNQTMTTLTFLRGEVIYLLELSGISETRLLKLAGQIKRLKLQKIVLRISDWSKAAHQISVLSYESGFNLKIFVIISCEEEIFSSVWSQVDSEHLELIYEDI